MGTKIEKLFHSTKLSMVKAPKNFGSLKNIPYLCTYDEKEFALDINRHPVWEPRYDCCIVLQGR